jgi:tyrosine-protein phosphatase MSG5
MEERRARKLSLASTSSTTSVTGLVVNSAPWRVRYGARSRAASMDSNLTSKSSASVLSEDPLEEEDEDEERDPTKVTTPDTDATDEDTHCFGMHDRQFAPEPTPTALFKPSLPPPSAPPSKVSFGNPFCPPSATPHQVSFPSSISGPSVASRRSNPPRITLTTSIVPSPPSAQELTVKKEKRRPPPLKDVTPVIPFPSIQIVPEPSQNYHPNVASSVSSGMSSRSRRLSARLSSLVPFSIKNALSAVSSSKSSSSSMVTPTPSASQTLFIFPPSPRARGVSTPSVMTLTSTPLPSATSTGIQTPLAAGFRKRIDSQKSWIGLSAVTPTTATTRVDVRGQFDA